MENNGIEAITIVGSGNVATHLATALSNSGATINGIYSRNAKTAGNLADQVGAQLFRSLTEINDNTDLIILAVPDIAIQDISRQLEPCNSLVVHVSGSTPIDALQPFFQDYGVFYPLQTFTKGRKLDYRNIPVCIEARHEKSTLKLKQLAGQFSNDVRVTTSHERLIIHLSAVYASNFVNYMNVIASALLERENISRDILFPLIRETMQKILDNHPHDVQTGPAVRGDHGTLQKHVELLSTDPENQKIYRILSEEILKYFKG